MAYQSVPGSGFHYLNSPFGDTTFTKVFVGGLAWETQSETLRRHFEQFGEILEAVVIADKNTGRSKGYGFVSPLFSFFNLSCSGMSHRDAKCCLRDTIETRILSYNSYGSCEIVTEQRKVINFGVILLQLFCE